MDYQKFLKAYELSGLSQSAFGETQNMSASMVSYYLKKARHSASMSFTEVSFQSQINISIKIKTSTGVEIDIPL
jgi:predicted transcriptional regulator